VAEFQRRAAWHKRQVAFLERARQQKAAIAERAQQERQARKAGE